MATTLLLGKYVPGRSRASYPRGTDGLPGPKTCTVCRESGGSFSRDRSHKDGLKSECKKCKAEARRRGPKEPGPKTCTICRGIDAEFSRDKTHKDGFRSTCKKCSHLFKQLDHKADPRKRMFRQAKKRAKQRGLDFTITIDDIQIPEYCPVLRIKLTPGSGGCNTPTLPSLDRRDNSKGYTKENICVISHRANGLKSDATTEELEALLRYTKGELK